MNVKPKFSCVSIKGVGKVTAEEIANRLKEAGVEVEIA